MKRLITAFAIVSTLLLSACAGTKIPLANPNEKVDLNGAPLYLLTITFKNTRHTSAQPSPKYLSYEKRVGKYYESWDYVYFDELGMSETDTAEQGNTYMLRFRLEEEGQYMLRDIYGRASIPPLFFGKFYTPLHLKMESKDKGVFYLGHIDATIRERKDNEFRAGPLLPLIDQATTGLSGGTWDITVSDQSEADLAKFKKQFPALKDVPITKRILPAFDRNKAQRYWEEGTDKE